MNKASLAVLALLCGLAGRCAAGPAAPEPVATLRRSAEGPRPDGSYRWAFETGNGIRAEEQGELRPGAAPADAPVASVRGSYSYRADDGSPVDISYTADERGFLPRGAVIPQPPALPAGIVRALEWIAAHPEEDGL